MLCFLNGEFLSLEQVRISPLDRGFLFGDGVYEVVPVYGGRGFCWRRHLARLARSLAAVRIGFEVEGLEAPARRLMAEAGGGARGRGCLYIHITRGVQEVRGLPAAVDAVPTVFMMCSPVAAPAGAFDGEVPGVRCLAAEDIRWGRCDVKAVSLLGAVLMAPAVGAVEAETMIFRDGVLCEGCRGNFVVVAGGELRVPRADSRRLEGVTYGVACELARAEGRRVVVRDIGREEVFDADEVWLASSLRELAPVTHVDGRVIGEGRRGPVFDEVHAAWRRFVGTAEVWCSE